MTGYARMVAQAYAAWQLAVGRSRPQPLSRDRHAGDRPRAPTTGSAAVAPCLAGRLRGAVRDLAAGPDRGASAVPRAGRRALRPLYAIRRRAASPSGSCATSPITCAPGRRAACGSAGARARPGPRRRPRWRRPGGSGRPRDRRGRPLDAATAAGTGGADHAVAPGRGLSRAAGRAGRGVAQRTDGGRSARVRQRRLLRRAAGRRHRAQDRRPRLLAARGEPDREREPTGEDVAAALAVARTRLADFARYRVLARAHLLLQRHRGRALHRRADRARLGAGRLLRATASSSAR